ncbi:hypothetical protein EPN52_04010 [bacterium]|nr:MAG: hypothetical protein EPN52_04010 [bacterium]
MSEAPRCPRCRVALRLKGRAVRVEGVRGSLYAIWCANCGRTFGGLWHPRLFRLFTERAVSMVLDGIVAAADAWAGGDQRSGEAGSVVA